MEIMILAKPSLLWNLLTNADPFFSLFTVVPPPAVVFPLLPSAAAGRAHHRDPSTGGDRLPCARSWVYPEQSFLICNPHRERYVEQPPLFAAPSCAAEHHQDVKEAFAQKRVYVCAGEWRFRRALSPAAGPRLEVYCRQPALKARRPLPSRLARLAAHSPARQKTAKAEAAVLGRHPSPTRDRSGCLSAGGPEGCVRLHGRGGGSGEAPGSVPAGITAGSPRKMDSVRRCALSAALLLHQLPQ
ncbi:uncharacterized protein LOC141727102 [Zonotrichia albicollis]|uniref:uncharacterized protein LOC141727102 n=1 Tax=Zonotrichia albicollis TaxID=44394 RepID=UPI003D8108FE